MIKAIIYTFFFFNILTSVQSYCPAECNCTQSPQIFDYCSVCLNQLFNRNISISSQNPNTVSCPCLDSYKQIIPNRNYCCAMNCSQCYEEGCYSCKMNWTLILSQNQYICNCKHNYYYDSQINDCLCSSRNPSSNQNINLFYEPSRFQCYLCPLGCQCDIKGCYLCDPKLNRYIGLSINNINTCYCIQNYTQVNNTCILTNNIIPVCTNNSCDGCKDPYFIDETGNCICKSIIDPTAYYQYKGKCYFCPYLCKCNQFGCIYCEISSNLTIQQNNCSCVANTIQIRNFCTCSDLYDNNTCACNSLLYPNEYYINSQSICKVCPQGCKCDQRGCYQCHANTNRNNNCICKLNFIEVDDRCIGCPTNFIFINNTCYCPNQVYVTLSSYYYYNQDQDKCKICPVDCSCDQTGCYFCNSTKRIIISNTFSIKICLCKSASHYQQNLSNICECIPPYVYNITSDQCQCQSPYYLSNSQCICQSNKQPTQYYTYTNQLCKICPSQCNCTAQGCIWCSPNSGRGILLRQSSSNNVFYICPCFPIQVVDPIDYCVSCLSSQYIWRNQCRNCDSTCLTCDEHGCLSCYHSNINIIFPTLQNKVCVCANSTLYYNSKGTCLCRNGYFFYKNTICELCPSNCKNCEYDETAFRSNTVRCTECNINVFRQNNPLDNCPCITGYTESYNKYCCHESCADCNITGCISCLAFSHRYVNNTDQNKRTCSCLNGFIQEKGICTCPIKYYSIEEECKACPQYCSSCSLITGVTSMISFLDCKCEAGYNRREINLVKQINYTICICNQSFFEYGNSAYCYSFYCKIYNVKGHCTQCIDDRILSTDGLSCTCQITFYQDSDFTCKKCSFGCIQCPNSYTCTNCNSSAGYYLISDQALIKSYCILVSNETHLLYQYQQLGMFQMKFEEQIRLKSIVMKRFQLLLISLNIQIKTIPLTVVSSYCLQNRILIIKFKMLQTILHPPYLIHIDATFNSDNNTNDFQKYFLSNDYIYNNNYFFNSTFDFFIYLSQLILLISAILFYNLGIKQNQLIFFMQTIYLVAMNIDDPQITVVPFLNYFGISMLNFFVQRKDNPFDYVIDWSHYMQYSKGNYIYFAIDNNFLRNVGLSLYLFLQNILLFIAIRIIYYRICQSQNTKYKRIANAWKKSVYRNLEWIQKFTLYPIIFFAWSTIINYSNQYTLINQSFRQVNFYLSILMIIITAFVMFSLGFFYQTSDFSKCQMIIEYVFSTLVSITIVLSVYSKYILLIIPLIFLRNCLLSINRYYWIYRSPLKLNLILFIWNIFQLASIISIYYLNFKVMIITLIIYATGWLIINCYLLYLTREYYKYDIQALKKAERRIQEMYDDDKIVEQSIQKIVMI